MGASTQGAPAPGTAFIPGMTTKKKVSMKDLKMTNLKARFSNFTEDQFMVMLEKHAGHAGQVACRLRDGTMMLDECAETAAPTAKPAGAGKSMERSLSASATVQRNNATSPPQGTLLPPTPQSGPGAAGPPPPWLSSDVENAFHHRTGRRVLLDKSTMRFELSNVGNEAAWSKSLLSL